MTNSSPVLINNHTQPASGWREGFLQRILVVTAIGSIFGLIPAVITTENLALQAIYIGVFASLVFTIIVNVPYLFKASMFVMLPLILGISETLNAGPSGDQLFLLLAFITFTALLIGPRAGIFAIVISQAVIIISGFLILTERVVLFDNQLPTGSLSEWVMEGVLFLVFSIVIISGIRLLQGTFEQTQKQNESILDTLRTSQAELEKRVNERTQDLARKNEQISASNFVSHEIAAVQDLNQLLNQAVELISTRFGYYHVAFYLINPRGDYATLQAASSEGGKKLVNEGYRLRVGVEGIVGFVAAERIPRIAVDVGEDAFYFDSPDLPETRSELALPLIIRDKVIGVLDMQSKEVQAFQYDELDMFQTLADQIAIAIENSRLLAESQMTISQLEIISSENSRRDWQIELLSEKPAFLYAAGEIRPVKKKVELQGKNVLEVPLVLRGQKIGKISLHRKDKFQNWTPQEETVAKEVANQAALALENVRLVERTRQRANREQEIAKMTARIRETLDLETVLRTSARELQSTLKLDEVEVRLLTEDNSTNPEQTP